MDGQAIFELSSPCLVKRFNKNLFISKYGIIMNKKKHNAVTFYINITLFLRFNIVN